jgi:hypothetical protein
MLQNDRGSNTFAVKSVKQNFVFWILIPIETEDITFVPVAFIH